MNTGKKAYTLSVLVEDTPGVLSQVARLFSRKGYNIESICSGPGLGEGTTRISVVTIVDEVTVHQIATQLSKLLLVISVDVLEGEMSIQRELVLIKVKAGNQRCPGGHHSNHQCVPRQHRGLWTDYTDHCRRRRSGKDQGHPEAFG